MSKLEEIKQQSHLNGVVIADGYDEAVIGIDYNNQKLVYSIGKCIQVLVKDHGMSYDYAVEFFDYNVLGYQPSNGPIFCWDEF